MGEKGRRVFRYNYKGQMHKSKKGGRIRRGRWGWLGWGEWWGRNPDNCT